MTALFGTDGIRGIPGRSPLTPELVRRIAYAAGRLLLERRRSEGWRLNGTPPLVLLGRDTRGSGPRLGRALAQGFSGAGCRLLDAGVIPTPAISYLAPRRKALCGVVVSASHNPPEFNGIKFFTAKGFKLPTDLEREIEARLPSSPDPGPSGGAPARDESAVREYLDFLRSTFPATRDLSGLRMVVDASNGAASGVASRLFRGLGAEVFEVGCSPDGKNINMGCGALDTARMRREVARRRAHCGVALDGDADRAVLADERGRLLDGDAVIALAALHLQRSGALKGGKVVLTVMSNLGLVRYLQERGIGTVEVPVGDRNVTDALEAGGYTLGGESSGHVVFRHLAPTGDGLLTALQTVAAWLQTGGALSRLRQPYRVYPQVLRNLRVERRRPLEELDGFQTRLEECRRRLGKQGRIFVRYSGTEPLLRILVEGPRMAQVREISEKLAQAFTKTV